MNHFVTVLLVIAFSSHALIAQNDSYADRIGASKQHLKNKEYQPALEDAQAAIRTDSSRWEGYALAGAVFTEQGQCADGVQNITRALDRAPQDKQRSLRQLMGRCLAAQSTPSATPVPEASQQKGSGVSGSMPVMGRGSIGIEFAQASTEPRDGVYLNKVVERSPADRAGLKEGDVILSVNDRKTETGDALIAAVANQKPGSTIAVTFRRKTGNSDQTFRTECVVADRSSLFTDSDPSPPANTAPNQAQATASAPASPTQAEVVLWKSIENSTHQEDFQAYLNQYPNGVFSGVARNGMARMQADAIERNRQLQIQQAQQAGQTFEISFLHSGGVANLFTLGATIYDCDGSLRVAPAGIEYRGKDGKCPNFTATCSDVRASTKTSGKIAYIDLHILRAAEGSPAKAYAVLSNQPEVSADQIVQTFYRYCSSSPTEQRTIGSSGNSKATTASEPLAMAGNPSTAATASRTNSPSISEIRIPVTRLLPGFVAHLAWGYLKISPQQIEFTVVHGDSATAFSYERAQLVKFEKFHDTNRVNLHFSDGKHYIMLAVQESEVEAGKPDTEARKSRDVETIVALLNKTANTAAK